MFIWSGKTAVVTGASSGIGASLVLELAKLGVNVVGLARRRVRVEVLAYQNKGLKGKIYAVACDVSDPKSIQEAIEWIEENIGEIHIWINNAGTWRSNQLTSDTLDDLQIIGTINTNLTGLALCCRKAVKLMEKSNADGYIINIGSLAGQLSASMSQVNFGTNVYASTKHAVKNLTEVLRLELASKSENKIRVSSISPGVVETNLGIAAGIDKETIKSVKGLKSNDISDAVIYLLSTPPSVNVTELTIRPLNSYH